MRSNFFLYGLIAPALAAEPFWNEPDTGLETYLTSTNWTEGSLPELNDMRAIPDFDFAARQKLNDQEYSFYRTAAAGEWSYRNNLDIWSKVKFRARMLTDVTKVNETMTTTILGYNFSAPIFIAPAARGAYGDPERAEINFVEATGSENILYAAALYASKTIEELAAAKTNNTVNGQQVLFQQVRNIFQPPLSKTNKFLDLHKRESISDMGRHLPRRENRRKSHYLDHRRPLYFHPPPCCSIRYHQCQQCHICSDLGYL